ncbi:MAG: mechanosensitive ion channel family protein [Acholeplasmatales bacterium]|nr:mechanosensitive ion channel family protein [Acholeplasmatales bacterium]
MNFNWFYEAAASSTAPASSSDAVASSVTETATAASSTTTFDWSALLDTIANWAVTTGIKLLISILIIIISFKIINVVFKRISRRLEKKKADATLSRVLVSTSRIACKILILIMIVGYLGIETASLSAVIASMGVGVGLAVQGTLSNFAGGVIIVVMRPFKLGDFITSNDQSGTVEDIKLFYTQIVTPDNKVIYIPNGTLANNVIVNASVKDDRRLDITMSVSYDTNLELAKNLLRKVCSENELVYTTPAPFVEVGEYASSSIEIYTRVWVKRADYWTVKWQLLTEFKNILDENHIEIPFNQLDVNIKK